MEIKKITNVNSNQTLNQLKINQSMDLNEIIVKREFQNNFNNNINYKIFSFIKRIRDVILIFVILSIISALIIFVIGYFSKNEKNAMIFKQNIINTKEIDGYYIPKDRLSNPIYKICSIDKCKKCYGNSINDTCISCFDSYKPIIDENNKIVSCQYIESNNITIKKSGIIEDKNETTFDEIIETSQKKAGITIEEITESTQEINYKIGITIEEVRETTQEMKYKVGTTIKGIIETTQNINYKAGKTDSDIKTDDINYDIIYSTEIEQKTNRETYRIQNTDIISYAILIYETTLLNEEIKLLSNKTNNNSEQGFYIRENSKFKLIDLEKNISIKSSNYIFDNIGRHLIKLEFKENITDFSYMFYECKNLIAITENFSANDAITLKSMFKGCSSLIYIENLQEWNVSQVTDFSYMFANCYSLKI